MIFDFFSVLFKKTESTQVTSKNDDIDVLETIDNEDTIIKKIPQQIKKQVVKTKKHDIIQTTQKDINMAEIFLVVIDTTGRVEAKNFQPGVQNFYFIYANDEDNAKQIVLSTFRKKPHIVSQLQFAVKATRLSSIIKTVGQGSNFWTYVPFGGQRQPGQQGIPPKPEALLRTDEYGNPSAQAFTPTQPIGGEEITQEDLRGVQFSGADANVLNKIRGQSSVPLNEEAPPMTHHQESVAVKQMADTNAALLQQNQAMMAQMAQMMAVMASNQPKSRKKAIQTEE